MGSKCHRSSLLSGLVVWTDDSEHLDRKPLKYAGYQASFVLYRGNRADKTGDRAYDHQEDA